METHVLPGRKTDRFLQMGIGKNLVGFGSGSRYMGLYANLAYPIPNVCSYAFNITFTQFTAMHDDIT